MTAVRADVAAMLRAGATRAQIKEQLHVSEHMIQRTRKILGIPLPPGRAKRGRAELAVLEDQAVVMLRAGASYNEIYAKLGLGRNRISELRKAHNIPVPADRDIWSSRRLTIDDAFARHTKPDPTGEHLLWTGPRGGRGFQLTASGRNYNARAVAFEKHHGRAPEGRLWRTCGHPDCTAGAHLTDHRIRQAHARADIAFDQIFGPDA